MQGSTTTFDLADDIHNKLHNQNMGEINNRSKEWMAMAPRGGRWSNNNNEGGDESNIVGRKEWEEEETKVVMRAAVMILSKAAAPTKMRLRMIWGP